MTISVEYPGFSFDVTKRDPKSRARLGVLKTPHGSIQTPNYIFCGTKASVRNMSPRQLREAKTDIILANTYHLMVQPGADLVQKMGGLHKFTGWDGPMMTDSGGFQIFSLGHGTEGTQEIKGSGAGGKGKSLLKITEEGAAFRSYKDGRILSVTPESSIETQVKLGADLIYQFDECTAYHHDQSYTAASMDRSCRWGDRSLAKFAEMDSQNQAVYGIVQGGIFENLRIASAEWTKDRPFFGTAIGGCLGTHKDEMGVIVNCMPHTHPDRPVHMLGIGKVDDVFNFVKLGIDTFDCVIPTRMARHGWALTKGVKDQRLNLRNARFADDPTPLDPDGLLGGLYMAEEFSRAYLHHLIKAGELLAMQIITQYNIAMVNLLMREVRAGLETDTLDQVAQDWLGPDYKSAIRV